ncbi:hypothetical protein FRC08_005051 [Ceratobasidium sp. 394]|nr:hypothetical protein FRC08_005051 [Ceratobasidium sp. 394]
MPTWGQPLHESLVGRANESDADWSNEDDEAGNPCASTVLRSGSSSQSQTPGSGVRSESYDYAFTPTEYSYESMSDSASQADIDTDSDVEMIKPLDQLIPISPMTSPPQSPPPEPPILEGQPIPDEVHPPPDIQPPLDRQEHPNPPGDDPQDDTAKPHKELPHALRALREWILKHSSTGDLTTQAADSLLRTLDMCLENDFLRCGPDTNTVTIDLGDPEARCMRHLRLVGLLRRLSRLQMPNSGKALNPGLEQFEQVQELPKADHEAKDYQALCSKAPI